MSDEFGASKGAGGGKEDKVGKLAGGGPDGGAAKVLDEEEKEGAVCVVSTEG